MKNLQGRSAILDVHAVDNTGKEFDCEIQRSDKGAGVKGRDITAVCWMRIFYM